jgi:hypothetical protein
MIRSSSESAPQVPIAGQPKVWIHASSSLKHVSPPESSYRHDQGQNSAIVEARCNAVPRKSTCRFAAAGHAFLIDELDASSDKLDARQIAQGSRNGVHRAGCKAIVCINPTHQVIGSGKEVPKSPGNGVVGPLVRGGLHGEADPKTHAVEQPSLNHVLPSPDYLKSTVGRASILNMVVDEERAGLSQH